MRVRALDAFGDWKFGRGKNDYKRDKNAVAQIIKTRLKSFLGDAFFDLVAGIDWFNLNGGKDIDELRIRIATVILNTPDVIKAKLIFVTLGQNRKFTIQYEVETIYGNIKDSTEVI